MIPMRFANDDKTKSAPAALPARKARNFRWGCRSYRLRARPFLADSSAGRLRASDIPRGSWYTPRVGRRTKRVRTDAEIKLLRGDSPDGVAVPDPLAETSIVEHVLYLGGAGRATPFTSTTHSRDAALHFAGEDGRVWSATAKQADLHGATYVDNGRLLRDLTGKGKGRCKHTSPWEVKQARANVELWSEHLLDWSNVDALEVKDRVRGTFS